MKKKVTDKREVREILGDLCTSVFEGDIDEIIEKLKNVKKKHEGCHRFDVSVNVGYGYYDDRYVEVELVGFRWETDEEVVKRIEKSKKAKLAAKKRAAAQKIEKEKKEKEELARLKAKYEG